jgi:hypothetical protein
MSLEVKEPHAVLIERNKLVGRRVARVLGGAGFVVRLFEEPPAGDDAVDGALLVVADAFDAQVVARWLRTTHHRPSLRAVLYTASESDRLIPLCLAEARVQTILGRPSFESPPREAELLAVARRVLSPSAAPFESHLAWGATTVSRQVAETAARDGAVAEVTAFAAKLGAPKRVGEMLGELTHELLMNAIYDAPVDEHGRPRFAHDRKAEVRLHPRDAATLRFASDGVRIAVEVEDRFGRLTRDHVFGGLARGLQGGEQDRSGGGAGLGLLVAWRSTTALHFDVEPGRRTRVTGLFDLDLNLREFRQFPKTIHFPAPVRATAAH